MRRAFCYLDISLSGVILIFEMPQIRGEQRIYDESYMYTMKHKLLQFNEVGEV